MISVKKCPICEGMSPVSVPAGYDPAVAVRDLLLAGCGLAVDENELPVPERAPW
ncbi:MAG: hypothetical protein HY905_00455 [Deltaproteobacteria bacterium]|nr:hypothetical protein [Deltaproteobacteria bacterium]